MEMFPKSILYYLFIAAAVCNLSANDGPAVQLGHPLVYKTEWNTQSIQAHDINRDGHKDLILLNNDEAKIDLLLRQIDAEEKPKRVTRNLREDRWNPIFKDAPFFKESVVTGRTMYTLRVADMDQDGLADLVFTSKRVPLTIYYQEEEGGFSEAYTHDHFKAQPWEETIKVAELYGKETQELIILGKENLLIYSFKQGSRTIPDPKQYPLGGSSPDGLILKDINHDTRTDILYSFGSGDYPFHLRLQDKEHRFDEAIAFPLQKNHANIQPFPQADRKDHYFSAIQKRTGLFETFHLKKKKLDIHQQKQLQPREYTTTSNGADDVYYTVGDFDGDGHEDIVTADSNNAEIRWYVPKKNQQGMSAYRSSEPFPAITQISSLSSGPLNDSDGDELLLFSKRESILAHAHYNGKRFTFPKEIMIDGNVKAARMSPLNSKNPHGIVMVVERDRDYTLEWIVPADASKPPEELEFTTHTSIALDESRRSPTHINSTDFNGDGLTDVIVAFRREPARLFLQTEEAPFFTEIGQSSSLRKSQMQDLSIENYTFGDVDRDGGKEILISGDGFLRAIKINKEEGLFALDQYNARSDNTKPAAPALLDIDQDGDEEIIFYDKSNNGFQVLKKEDDGVYRYATILEAGRMDARYMRVLNGADEEPRILLFGKTRFWNLPISGEIWFPETWLTYETDIKDMNYSAFKFGDLNQTAPKEAVMIDHSHHALEILRLKKLDEKETNNTVPKKWHSDLHFVVFDVNRHYQGRTGNEHEPREWIMEDVVRQDGHNDLIVLVHDRILIYPQLPKETKQTKQAKQE